MFFWGKKYKYIWAITLLFVGQILFAKIQEENNLAKIDYFINDLNKTLETVNPDSSIKVCKKTIEMIDWELTRIYETKSDTIVHYLLNLKADSFRSIGRNYNEMDDYNLAIDNIMESSKYYKKTNNLKDIAKNFNSIGYILHKQGNYVESLEKYHQAKTIYKEIESKIGIANTNTLIANIHIMQGNYQAALSFYFESLKIYEEIDDKEMISLCYSNLGVISSRRENFEKALDYYQKSLEIKEDLQDTKGIARINNNIGIIYRNLGKLELAAKHYLSALDSFLQLNDKRGISAAYNNLGVIAFKQEKYDNALANYNKSLKLKKELNDKHGHSLVNASLADLYLQLSRKQPDKKNSYLQKALRFAQKSQKLSEELQSLPDKRNIANTMMLIYQAMGDYQKSLSFAKKYINYTDSLLSEDKTKALAEMESKYEIERKQLEIDNLNKENALKQMEIQQTNYTLNKQYQIIIILIVGFAIILVFVLILIKIVSQRNHANKLLAEKNKEILKQREEIQKQNTQLNNKNNILDELLTTRDKFISILAHDLRNPFNIILGASEILSTGYDSLSEKKIKSLTKSIHESTKNTYKLFEELLEWGKSQLGSTTFNPQNCHISSLIDKALNLSQDYANSKNISLHNQTEDDFVIKIDIAMIKTILRNLINNALKFTPQDGSVIVCAKQMNNEVLIKVEDTGIGMDEKTQESLFDLKNNNSRNGTNGEIGTGFGLILTKEFVDKHDGKIWIESEKNKGSKFFISLPQN